MSPAADFEVLRFEAVPATGGVAVVELDGAFTGARPGRPPSLLVEHGGRSVEVPAVATSQEPWSASFAVTLDVVVDRGADFALAFGRGPLIALPAPTLAGGPGDDRYVRLARQANELRHQIAQQAIAVAEADAHEAAVAAEHARVREEQAEALARVRAETEAERNRLAAELETTTAELERARELGDAAAQTATAARDQRRSAEATTDALREELAGVRDELRATGERATAAERDRAALRARAEAAERAAGDLREQAAAHEEHLGRLQAEIVAAEDEARAARRELRDTRARLETVLREQRHAQVGAPHRGHVVEDEAAEHQNGIGETPTARFARPDGGDAEDEHRNGTAETQALEPERGPEPDDDTEATAIHETAVQHPAPARAKRTVRIFDDGADDVDVLDPAAVGARHIEPAEIRAGLTPARIAVAAVLIVLLVLLVAILLGAGFV